MAVVWNYCCATPVIIGWLIHAVMQDTRAKKGRIADEAELTALRQVGIIDEN